MNPMLKIAYDLGCTQALEEVKLAAPKWLKMLRKDPGLVDVMALRYGRDYQKAQSAALGRPSQFWGNAAQDTAHTIDRALNLEKYPIRAALDSPRVRAIGPRGEHVPGVMQRQFSSRNTLVNELGIAPALPFFGTPLNVVQQRKYDTMKKSLGM